MTSGERLKRLRTERGWSLRELSKRCGIAFSVLSHLEGGRRKMTDRYAGLLGEVFPEARSWGKQLSLPFDQAAEIPLTKERIATAKRITRREIEIGQILQWPSGMVLIVPKGQVIAAGA